MTYNINDVHSEARRHAFFVEWRVTDPSFIQGMEKLQQDLLQVEPKLQVLQSCAANNIHVTMNQLTLKNDDELNRAIQVVKTFEANDFHSLATGVTMKLGGFDDFNKKVLFVKVKGEGCSIGEDPLLAMFQALQTRFTEANLNPKTGGGGFKAHLTVCKAPQGKGKNRPSIPDSVFERVKELEGTIEGQQKMNSLVFCVKRLQHEDTPPVLYNISL